MEAHPVYNRLMVIKPRIIRTFFTILLIAAISAGCLPGSSDETQIPTVNSGNATIYAPTLPVIVPTSTDEPTAEVNSGGNLVETAAPMETLSPVEETLDPVVVMDPLQLPTPTISVPSILSSSGNLKPRPAAMKITRPGPYSKVSSPIQLEALISPGDDRLIYIDVIGEDGRIIVSQILDFRNYDSLSFFISPEIPFEIKSAAELARIVVYVNDQFGQKIHLVSVDVILIQLGDSDLTVNEIEFEPYMVKSPGEGALISGGVLLVEGTARLVADSPLVVDLINQDGAVVGTGETQVSPPSQTSSHMPFQVVVPYAVSSRTRVRMTLRQESTSRIPGTVWLSSSVIFLDP